jgi:hypothetical protein
VTASVSIDFWRRYIMHFISIIISAAIAVASFVGLVIHGSVDPSGKCQRRGKRVIIIALIALGAGMICIGVTRGVSEAILMLPVTALFFVAIPLIMLLILSALYIIVVYCDKTERGDSIFLDRD